jgi:mRNA-degrading endonuclease YafQ of YafQ-DinJ toxin-antitoxin module
MVFVKSAEFQRAYNLLPKHIQKKVKKQLFLFEQNPRHPSLSVHRLNGEWELYVDIHYRCLFRWKGSEIELLTIGTHKVVDRYKRK